MTRKKILTGLIILFLFLVLPITLFLVKQQTNNRSNASAPDQLEAEGGVLNSLAQTKSDTNASGGSYVEFGVSNEFTQIRDVWRDYLTGGDFNTNDPSLSTPINNKLDSIRTKARNTQASMIISPDRTYLFPNIPGPDGGFGVADTYEKIETMALAYATKDAITDPQEKEALYKSIKDGLIWLNQNWYNKNKCPGNDYSNRSAQECAGSLPYQVGSAQSVSNIIILVWDRLNQDSDAQKIINNNMDTVERFYPNGGLANRFYPAGIGVHDTAGNLAMTTEVLIVRAAIKEDQIPLNEALKNYRNDFLKYKTSGDGLYADGSFIQHKNHPYNNWYGALFINRVAEISYLLLKSGVITANEGNTLYQMYKNAYQPLKFNKEAMDLAMGRISSRPRNNITTNGVSGLSTALVISRLVKGDAYKYMAEDILRTTGGSNYTSSITNIIWSNEIAKDPSITKPVSTYTITKSFPRMDKAVMIKPDYTYAISMSSSRTYNYETIDGVNKKAWYMSDGMVYFYNKSDPGQYNDWYWATVDKTKLAGTTVDELIKLDQNNNYVGTNYDFKFSNYLSTRNFANGAILNNTYAALGMSIRSSLPLPVLAKKSWFLLDDKVVAIGSDIESASNTKTQTIVDNRKINSTNKLVVDGNPVSGTSTITDPNWAYLEGTGGYYFPKISGLITSLTASIQNRAGSWRQLSNEGDTPIQTRTYAQMWFNHGLNPTNGKYAYILLPNRTQAQTQTYSQNSGIQILALSNSVHAIKEIVSGIIGANFYGPGNISFINSLNQSSVVLKEKDGILDFFAADPVQNQDLLTFELTKNAKGVISKDAKITIVSLTPIKFTINTTNALGKSFNIKFEL